ncbi:hypothetical protein [Paenibacillus spongiae]|uniref:Uncharacterized protein n=1 Tax=Paenibacillus spongiae TaxID=2909671 RepID=A0ABY5SCJ9_9BACL|nr:hypothetical protein [Paenibacillus spongiae]UVI31687.1 hypothetical protein L1F29_07680 [Paenibacillus spongiae]
MGKEAVFELKQSQIRPVIAPSFELPLAVLLLPAIQEGGQIDITIEVGWVKPSLADSGELELVLRRGTVVGPELLRSLEICQTQAISSLVHTVPVGGGIEEPLVLTIRSLNSKAIVTGPIRMKASVR